ncbi:replication-relaxation family protein [Streptomyces liliifuscus]|uniref:replication-relaxation family protein n=1 Tax=Streptomyces liliifuscus TaxID=2797636 RepID=UPI001F1C81A4|nr:replication-relaxation family protein [Streptomyces liliifuscus]
MPNVDAGAGDRLALAVLVQYRMATTEQMHWVIAPEVRIEQTRRRLARLREAGLVDRITLPGAGRTRVWFPTRYGVQLACEWPEMRGRRPSRTVSDPTAVRLKVGHALTVTRTALAFLQDARRNGDLCRPLDWIPLRPTIRQGAARRSSPTPSCTTGVVPPTTTGRCCGRS